MDIVSFMNSDKIVSGLAMVILQFGAKNVITDVGRIQEKILSNIYVKKLIIFVMFFVATKDLYIASGLFIGYIIIVDWMLNEKHKFCILPREVKNKYLQGPVLTEDEYLNLKKKLQQYEQNIASLNEKPETPIYDMYIEQMSRL